jgi:hypothetical protein
MIYRLHLQGLLRRAMVAVTDRYVEIRGWFEVSPDPEPVAEGIAVRAANGDLFTIDHKLMNFDHADMPDAHHV